MISRDREQYFGKLQGDIEKSLPSFWGGKKWSRDMSMGVMKPSSIIKEFLLLWLVYQVYMD